MSHKNNRKIKKEEVQYLSASDIVNGAGPLYAIKEVEMESAINQLLNEDNREYDY